MRRLAAAVVAFVLLGAGVAWALDHPWDAMQNGKGTFTAYNLSAPSTAPTPATAAVRMSDVTPGTCITKSPGANTLPFVCAAAGTDYAAAGNYVTSLTGPITAAGPGAAATTITNNAVSYANIQDVSAASRIMCRGSASGAGDMQECTAGSGVTITGTVISATGSGGTVTGVTASLPLTSSGGATPDIAFQFDNTTLTLTGGNALQRAALTGDVTASAGGNATTIATNIVSNSKFRQSAGLSAVVNATNATANVADLTASGPLQFLSTNSAGTAIVWASSIPYSSITSQPTATWTLGAANRRLYLVDGVNGNDANVGYLDGGSSNFPISGGTIAATAKKTIGALEAIFPKYAAGRDVEVIIANGGSNTTGTYAGGLQSFMDGTYGWAFKSPLVRGTGTNTTAGATAFAGDSADLTYLGGVTATGCNSAGYNPIGSPTTSVVQLQKAGGGSAAIPAEPLAPLGWRFRCDSATTTTALRNIARVVTKVTTTTTTNDTLTFVSALPATPAGGDVCYLEQAGVVVAGGNFNGPPANEGLAIAGLTVAGVMFNTALNYQGGISFAFSGATASVGFFSSNVSVRQQYVHPTAGTITPGGGFHASTSWFQSRGGALDSHALVVETTTTLDTMSAVNWKNGCVAGTGISITGTIGNNSGTITSVGSTASETGHQVSRVLGSTSTIGAGMAINNSRVQLGNIDVSGIGTRPAILVLFSDVTQLRGSAITGSTGNTDVGVSFSTGSGGVFSNYGGSRWIINFGVTNTITGSLGDVRTDDSATVSTGEIITWAQAANGILDAKGNMIVGSGAAFPIRALNSGTILSGGSLTVTSLAGSGTRFVTATSTGLLGTSAASGLLADPGGNGIVVRTSAGTTTVRTLATDASISISNADGVSAAPTFSRAALTGDVTASAGSNATTLATVGGGAGSCTFCSVTFDAKGRQTAYSSGTPVTSVSGTATRVTSSGGQTPVIDLVATAVTPGSYTLTNLTVDAYGRITAASNGSAGGGGTVTSVTASLPLTSSGGAAPNIALNYDAASITLNGSNQIQVAAQTGDVTKPAGSNATTIANQAVIYAKIQNLATDKLLGRDSAGAGSAEEIGLSTGLQFTGAGSIALTSTGVTAASYTYGSFTVDAQGRLTAASSGAAPEVPLTFSTGLTRSTNTITANISTGVSGGQTAVGGTAAGNRLRLSSTTNGTKGGIDLGTSAYDEANNRLGIGTASPSVDLEISANANAVRGFKITNASAGTSAQVQNVLVNDAGSLSYYGIASSTFTGFTPINTGKAFVGSNATDFSIFTQDAHDIILYTNAVERLRIASGGGVTVASINSGNGLVKGVSGLLTLATANVDYQTAITWPANHEFLESRGAGLTPIGRAGFLYDAGFDLIEMSDGIGSAHYNIGGGSTGNYERVSAQWSGGVWTLASEKGGTGTVRGMKVTAGTAILTLDGSSIVAPPLAGSGTRFVTADSAGILSTTSAATASFIFAYGDASYGVNLPSFALGHAPNFWMRPMTYTTSPSSEGFAAFDQVWEYDTGDTFTHADLSVYAYQCGISVSGGGQDDLIFVVTKNGSDTGVTLTVLCPSATATNTNYGTGGTVSFGPTDRIGVRVHDTNGGSYSSGALRATVTLRLRP